MPGYQIQMVDTAPRPSSKHVQYLVNRIPTLQIIPPYRNRYIVTKPKKPQQMSVSPALLFPIRIRYMQLIPLDSLVQCGRSPTPLALLGRGRWGRVPRSRGKEG
jgi:hypothetical protein